MRIYRHTEAATSDVFTAVFILAVNKRVEKQQSFFCTSDSCGNSTETGDIEMAKAAAKKAPAKKAAAKKPAAKKAKKK